MPPPPDRRAAANPNGPASSWGDEPYRRMVETIRDYGVFLLDTEGNVASWNEGAERIKGYKAQEIIGRNFSNFYPQSAIDKRWPKHELETAARLGHFEDEGWRVRKDGTMFWANVVITAIRNEDGQLLGFSKITRDLSERREQEERLRQSEERFRLLLEGVEDYAIHMLDPQGRVTSWNAGSQKITGYTADEIVGQSFESFFPPEDIATGRPAAELRTATLNRRATDIGWRVRKDGTRFWAEVMVTALHDEEGRLRGFAKVTRDLSEKKRIENLEEQGRHLTEFLAMLAHELRNPLAPIRSALGILAGTPDLPPQTAWCRDVIERQASHLTRLVDDLLDVSRITRGKLSMHTATMDVNAAVARALEAAGPLVGSRRHRLAVDLAPAPVQVNGDMTRLVQVIVNLLHNAGKYTPEGGDIALAVAVEANDALIRVKDNGIGIPPDMLEHVFDLFAQGERTLARTEGGLGIGLTLARRIVALHGGSIKATSPGAGQGAEFIVRLPLLPAYARNLPVALEQASTLSRRSVVVVDDNEDAAESMAMLLRTVGHDVHVEHDGAIALKRLTAQLPDIVLLDIGLPGLDGYEVARRLREHPGGTGVRIYAMTGYGQDEDRRRSLAAGFDGHLVKPVMPSDLFALVDGKPATH